jgi:hypothetical protein
MSPAALTTPANHITTRYHTSSLKRYELVTEISIASVALAPGHLEPSPPSTTAIEVILSDGAGMHTGLETVPFTPTLHTHVAPTHQAQDSQIKAKTHVAEADVTTITGTRTFNTSSPLPLLPSSFPPPPPLANTTTILTLTRTHPLSTTTHTSYVDAWPQIGSIPDETSIPGPWRETYEEKALRQQYISLGAICGILVVGVVGVLVVGCWKWVGEVSGRGERVEEGEHRWDWF